ncbi:MAG: hypothetical protein ACJA06_002001 [Halocynthiibacter sp.]
MQEGYFTQLRENEKGLARTHGHWALLWRCLGGIDPRQSKGPHMGINSETDITANIQIGPTSQGMVRLYVEGDGIEVPMDFDPEEAEEIAEEIRAAAAQARALGDGGKGKKR